MPETRYYTIRRVSEVKVTANNEVQAAVMAKRVLDGEEWTAEPGISVSRPKVVELHVIETSIGGV